MKLIALSPDLKKGITTISFGHEPTVDTTKSNLLGIDILESDFDSFDSEGELAQKKFKKLYKKYDFCKLKYVRY